MSNSLINEKKNNMLIPTIILIAFIAFIGFVSLSLYTQVVDGKGIIELKDNNISTLSADLNTTTSMLNSKKAELLIANANVAALTNEKTNLDINLNNKINQFNMLDQNYNDLNLAYNDLNLYSYNRDINLNNIYLQYDIVNTYKDEGYIDKEFDYCSLPTDVNTETGGYKYGAYNYTKKIRLYNKANTYFNNLYSGEYYDESTILDRTNNKIQDLLLENIYFNSSVDYMLPVDEAFEVISLVQKIPYDNASVNFSIAINKYPYNVLYNNIGICAEKSYLMATLLSELGYGTGIFLFDTHAAVGIKCPANYDYKDSGYCLIESTILSYVGEFHDSTDSIYNGYEGIVNISNGKEYEYAGQQYVDYHDNNLDKLYNCR